jgi:Zn-dependent peptidase ImmA (M78 family)/DNA-binding XRE family transcriptional regulator
MSRPFSPTRLTAAREYHGVTKKFLAEAIGVTPANISAYESGQWSPNVEVLKEISRVLDFPLSWFWQDELPLVDNAAPTFRAQSRMTAQTRGRALRTWDFAFLINIHLEDEFNLCPLLLPDYSSEIIESKDSLDFAELAAGYLRDEWRLGGDPIENMVHLLESKGISIFWTNILSRTVDACCHWADDRPIILLNSNVTQGERSRFNLAHELGHLVLHREEIRRNLEIKRRSQEEYPDSATFDEEMQFEENANAAKRREAEANRFASAFLLPFRSWSQETPLHSEPDFFLHLKPRWKVSAQAMIRRSFDLRILSEYQYETAMTQVSMRQWRTHEPDPLPCEQSLLHEQLFQLLQKRGQSAVDFSRQLHMRISVLQTLMPISKEFMPDNLNRLNAPEKATDTEGRNRIIQFPLRLEG